MTTHRKPSSFTVEIRKKRRTVKSAEDAARDVVTLAERERARRLEILKKVQEESDRQKKEELHTRQWQEKLAESQKNDQQVQKKEQEKKGAEGVTRGEADKKRVAPVARKKEEFGKRHHSADEGAKDVKKVKKRLAEEKTTELLKDVVESPIITSFRVSKASRGLKKLKKTKAPVIKIAKKVIMKTETLSLKALAALMGEKVSRVEPKALALGWQENTDIDTDMASLLVQEFGHEFKVTLGKNRAQLQEGAGAEETQVPRPPIVTIMGHVDHGKTSLLDALRRTKVVDKEAGGITQHLGAYQISPTAGRAITFLDTPGHAAFTAMRARGAKITDVVVIVVAADDGLKEQTLEAIDHAKAAQVPIVIAINKMDHPQANAQKVKESLLQHDVILEDWGGDVLCAEISAKTGHNLIQLCEVILLQADMLNLKASDQGTAQGFVLESRQEKGAGSVASVILKTGTLSVGDIFTCGSTWGKVRRMVDDQGQGVRQVTPGSPVEMTGFDAFPAAGDMIYTVDHESTARKYATQWQDAKMVPQQAGGGSKEEASIEDLWQSQEEESAPRLNLVIKADTQGALDALFQGITQKKDRNIQVLHRGVGAITESDVMLAKASQASLISFHVRPTGSLRTLMEKQQVRHVYHDVIYHALDDVDNWYQGLFAPETKEEILGTAKVLEIFHVPKIGVVAGSLVQKGLMVRGASVRLLRDQSVVYTGTLESLRRYKDSVKEAKTDQECGIVLNYQDVKPNDLIECFRVVEEA